MHKLPTVLAFVMAAALTSPQVHAAERALDKEVVLNATLAQAWDAWTTREGITSFFAPDARIEPRVGGAFQVYIDPGAPAGSKGSGAHDAPALELMATAPTPTLLLAVKLRPLAYHNRLPESLCTPRSPVMARGMQEDA